MASAKKKLDEKNLKILRELVSKPENKHCFDCKQRGPTYINMTIGSFVCTTCSGMLRGLTPPHRVKSISMATFNQEEIEFISARGNEYCRKVWLGLFDEEQLSKDEQQIKDFMISKYERKRYFVKAAENEFLAQNGNVARNNQQVNSNNIPKIPPLSTNLTHMTNGVAINNNNPKIYKNNNVSPEQKRVLKNGINFIDPFNPVNFNQNQELSNQQETMDFANFDDNPVFNSSQGGTPNNFVEQSPPPPSEDRYAALKALDSLMKSQVPEVTPPPPPQNQPNNDWASWPHASVFETSTEEINNQSSNICNPFSTGFENGWKNTQFVGNPFKAEISWSTNNISNGSTNQFNPSKSPWETQIPNPFSVGTAGHTSNNSNNPFL